MLTVAVIGATGSLAHAAPGIAADYDATAGNCPNTIACGASGTTKAYTVPGTGSNHWIVVGVATTSGSAPSAVTFNGVTMGAVVVSNAGCSCDSYLYAKSVAAGTSGNVVATGGASVQVFSFANVGSVGNTANTSSCGGPGAIGGTTVSSGTGQVVVDFGCATSTGLTNPANLTGPPQNRVMLSRFVPAAGKIAVGSWRSANTTFIAPSYTLTGTSVDMTIAMLSLRPTYTPTAIRLDQLDAHRSGGIVELLWRTGSEFDNLGFHVYRDDGQGRFRITQTPILGAALLTGSGISLAAGQRYGIRDILGVRGTSASRYWLEDIDMNGTTGMHGPIYPDVTSEQSPGAPTETAPAPAAPPVEPTFALAPAPFVLPEAPPSIPAVLADDPTASSAQGADRQWQLAAGTGLKIGVNQTGWHQLTGADLVGAGLSWNTDPRRLSLFLEGREVPIQVRGGEDGLLDESDAVGFYGQAINANSTDTRVYWLTDQLGSRVRIQAASGGAVTPGAPVSTVSAVTEWRPRTLYFAALTNGDEDNFFGSVIGAELVSKHLTLSDRSAGAPVTIEIGVQGVSVTPHTVSVEIGGQSVAQIVLVNRERRSVALTVPESMIVDDGIELVFRSSGGTDLTLVDFVRARYRRNANAVDGQAQFVIGAGEGVAMGGFSPGEDLQVLDVTDPEAPRLISATPADDAGQVAIAASSGAARSVLVRSAEQSATPAFVTANQPSRLNEKGNGGALVVIGAVELLSAFQPLKALRESQGWVVTMVDVQDVYDEFSFGSKHPDALRAFMVRARQWASPPRALILLGDATFDPRDFLGKGAMDRVPTKLVDTTFMETASDDWFTDFDDDGIADVPVGRLPARTLSEAVTMVSKLVDAPLFRSADEVAKAVPALFVADSPDTENGYDFPVISQEVSGAITSPLKTVSFRRGDPGMDAAAFQALMQTRPAFIGYAGHGSQELWAGGLLGTDLDAELGTSGPDAFWMDLTCLNGFFHDVYKRSLAEQLLLRPGAGAFGVWASTALTDANTQKELGRAFVDQLWNRGAMVGEAAMFAKRQLHDVDIRRSWILFGDPTWRPAMFADPGDDYPDAGVGPMAGDGGAADATAGERDAPVPPPAPDAGCACAMARSGGSATEASSAGAVFLLALALCAALRRRGRLSRRSADV